MCHPRPALDDLQKAQDYTEAENGAEDDQAAVSHGSRAREVL